MKMIFFFILISNVGLAQNSTLKVSIKGFEHNKGKLYLEVLDTNKKSVKQLVQAIADKKAMVEINDLPSGKYSVRVFHDENDNKKLDTGMFGMPKEPWGMSNNVKAVMGPPDFKESLIDLKGNKEISITVH